MRRLVIASGVALLAACASVPKPPVVDGLSRKPVNNAATNEILRLRAELAATREQLRVQVVPPDTSGLPPVAAQSVEPAGTLAAVANAPAPQPAKYESPFDGGVHPLSALVSVSFPYNSVTFTPTAQQAESLALWTTHMQRITVRGRTDDTYPNPRDERVALLRALAAKNYLVSQGVPASSITVNYLSAGDYIADNSTPEGRAQNRRVDIAFTFRKGEGS